MEEQGTSPLIQGKLDTFLCDPEWHCWIIFIVCDDRNVFEYQASAFIVRSVSSNFLHA